MRVAMAAAAVGLVLALSGCHEVLEVFVGNENDDPPVHNVGPPAGPAGVDAIPAAAGRAFSGRADGELASRIVLKHGFVVSTIKKVRFIGEFKGKLTGPPAPGDDSLGPLANSTWHGEFSSARNRATGKIKMSGLILATYPDPSAGRSCLRLKYNNAKTKRKDKRGRRADRNRGTSTIKILGGEGGAATLAGSATVKVRLASDKTMIVTGRVKATRGRARAFPLACTRLEKKFRLQPVP
jgi:hypothetical protein